MVTNNEIAAFEDFKYKIGDVVEVIALRVFRDSMVQRARELGMRVDTASTVGMIVCRVLLEDEAGTSRVYRLHGINCDAEYKEFELEALSVSR